jgi:hypothetical protein
MTKQWVMEQALIASALRCPRLSVLCFCTDQEYARKQFKRLKKAVGQGSVLARARFPRITLTNGSEILIQFPGSLETLQD